MRNDYLPVIPKDKLKDGAYYQGVCRNASLARWDAKTEMFYHWRHKFGSRFVDEIHCPEDEEHYDVFVAMAEVPTPLAAQDVIPTPV